MPASVLPPKPVSLFGFDWKRSLRQFVQRLALFGFFILFLQRLAGAWTPPIGGRDLPVTPLPECWPQPARGTQSQLPKSMVQDLFLREPNSTNAREEAWGFLWSLKPEHSHRRSPRKAPLSPVFLIPVSSPHSSPSAHSHLLRHPQRCPYPRHPEAPRRKPQVMKRHEEPSRKKNTQQQPTMR